jgi:opacity protein-like surface antigen
VQRCVSLNESGGGIDTVTVTDTVTEYVEVTHYLPSHQSAETLRYDEIAATDYTVVLDTVFVRLPVTQKVYSDSDYTAYVSGIDPSLDSIRIYHYNQHITNNTVVTVKQPPKRWNISLQSGIGITPDKIHPYIGIGVGYTLLQW